jgi:ribonuclease T2
MPKYSFAAAVFAAVTAIVVAGSLCGPAAAQYSTRDDVRSNYDDRKSRGNEPAYRRNAAGDFDYYALVLSWSPTHCAEDAGRDDDLQCNRVDGRRYAFILHGLWPQYDKGYPSNCTRQGSTFIPQQMIDRMLDIMPSKQLIIHEYRKHGTCSGLAPFAYFEFARKEFQDIKVPKRYQNPFETQFVTPDTFLNEIANANPGLKPESLVVVCGGPGNRLQEMRICLSKNGDPVACGSNENQRRLCSASQMFVPPVRSTSTAPDTVDARDKVRQQTPLPMPKIIPWND